MFKCMPVSVYIHTCNRNVTYSRRATHDMLILHLVYVIILGESCLQYFVDIAFNNHKIPPKAPGHSNDYKLW